MIQFGYVLRQEDILNDFVVLLDDTSVNCVETTVGVWLKSREKWMKNLLLFKVQLDHGRIYGTQL